MRQTCLALTVLLGLGAPAWAQVTVDLQALDALPGNRPAAKEPGARRSAPKSPPHRSTGAKPKQSNGQAAKSTPVPPAAVPPPAAPTVTPPAVASTPPPTPAPPPATLPAA